MTNNIAPLANTATPVRETSEALAHGARAGQSALPFSRDLAFSFQNLLDKGARMDAKDITASLGLGYLAAPEPASTVASEATFRRPREDDAPPASDDDSAGDDPEWDTTERDRETETAGGRDNLAAPSPAMAALNPPVAADAPQPHAGEGPPRPPSGSPLAADTATSGPRAKEVSDPSGAPLREAAGFQASPERPGAAASAADPVAGGADARVKTAAAPGQAQDLAASLPAGKTLKIDVAVAKPGDILFSQPASSLAVASVAGGQKNASRPGELPVGASAKAGFTAANAGQVPSGGRPAVQAASQPDGNVQIRDPRSPSGAPGNPHHLAAAPRNGGTAASPTTGAFADVTGIGSSGTPEAARSAGSAPGSTPGKALPPQPPVAQQISVQISKAVKAGVDQIDIQLRPKELGRIDVRLELAGDGRVSATITADNRETLELLRTDARGLEKALDDAGLKADSNSLNFNLRGQDGRPSGNPQSQTGRPSGRPGEGQAGADGDPAARTLGDYSRGGAADDGRIDIEI